MLAGLLFASHHAEDRPGRLTATLPFAGATLIERQARQLIAAGAAQLVVVAPGFPPDLMGALSRIGRAEVAVDAVRSAAEAAEKLHPLSRVLMLADGLITADDTVLAMAREGGDALLVVPGEEAADEFERVGGRMAWAGIARLQSARVAEVAALPRDYDMQSALIRAADQAGAVHLMLPEDGRQLGHGIARAEHMLPERERRVLAAFFAGRRNWFDRFVVAPVARLALPLLASRGTSATTAGVGAGVLGAVGLGALWAGYARAGTVLVLLATLAAILGGTLGGLRGEARAMRGLAGVTAALPLAAGVLLGASIGSTALVTGLGLAILGGLGERACRVRERWWGGPPAYALLLTVATLAGVPAWGLGLAALYAAATLGAAIEGLRWEA